MCIFRCELVFDVNVVVFGVSDVNIIFGFMILDVGIVDVDDNYVVYGIFSEVIDYCFIIVRLNNIDVIFIFFSYSCKFRFEIKGIVIIVFI